MATVTEVEIMARINKGRTFQEAMLSKIAKTEAAMNALPHQLNRASLKHFKQSFRRGGFTDESFQKWKPKITGEPSYLTKKGRLKRSFKTKEQEGKATITNTAPYSIIHNKGIGRMPQRKFMGESQQLTEEHKRLIILQINTALHG